MTTVYVVTSGSYSNYQINAVFLDRARAERYVDLYGTNLNGDSFEIESFDTETGEALLQRETHSYGAFVQRDGAIDLDRISMDNHDCIADYGWPRWQIVKSGAAQVYLQARDREHAAKIIADERRVILAHDLWKPGPVDVGKVIAEEHTE